MRRYPSPPHARSPPGAVSAHSAPTAPKVADLNLHPYEEFEAEAKDMTGDSTVAEIEASGGTALRIEVEVRDEAVTAMFDQAD
jgi:hypothetical protein